MLSFLIVIKSWKTSVELGLGLNNQQQPLFWLFWGVFPKPASAHLSLTVDGNQWPMGVFQADGSEDI